MNEKLNYLYENSPKLTPEYINDILKLYDHRAGPIINEILIEILNSIDVEYHVTSEKEFEVDSSTWIVPRWDIYLYWDLILSGKEKEYPIIQPFLKADHIISVIKHSSKSEFKSKMDHVRQFLLDKMDIPAIAQNKAEACFLILKRSPEPAFYKQNGNAELKGYGISRRSLVDIDETLAHLHEQQIHVEAYEPGKNTFMHQVRTFKSCAGVIAIRGAELANIIWLEPNSKVIVISPTFLNHPSVPKELARILGLAYIELETTMKKYPSLLEFDLASHLH